MGKPCHVSWWGRPNDQSTTRKTERVGFLSTVSNCFGVRFASPLEQFGSSLLSLWLPHFCFRCKSMDTNVHFLLHRIRSSKTTICNIGRNCCLMFGSLVYSMLTYSPVGRLNAANLHIPKDYQLLDKTK